jgi:hypothetical protein
MNPHPPGNDLAEMNIETMCKQQRLTLLHFEAMTLLVDVRLQLIGKGDGEQVAFLAACAASSTSNRPAWLDRNWAGHFATITFTPLSRRFCEWRVPGCRNR